MLKIQKYVKICSSREIPFPPLEPELSRAPSLSCKLKYGSSKDWNNHKYIQTHLCIQAIIYILDKVVDSKHFMESLQSHEREFYSSINTKYIFSGFRSTHKIDYAIKDHIKLTITTLYKYSWKIFT